MSADCPECEHPDNDPTRHYNIAGKRTYYECANCGCDWSIYTRSAEAHEDVVLVSGKCHVCLRGVTLDCEPGESTRWLRHEACDAAIQKAYRAGQDEARNG